MTEAAIVARREPEIIASSGTATSQMAAAELAPPVSAARQTTMPVRPSEDRACAIQSEPVRDRMTAATSGRNRLAMASASMPLGTPRQTR